MVNKYEKNVPYVVFMKPKSQLGYGLYTKFTGYLVNNACGNFYFELENNRMLVIVPHNDIEYMYPSATCFERYEKSLIKEE